VTLQVHEPVPTPKIEAPTTEDARALATRIESIVRGGASRATAVK